MIGERVYVYRNLHKPGLFSVLYKGKVCAHVESILLHDVEFRVRPGGRARVLRTGKKNVHAFAIGTVCAINEPPPFCIEGDRDSRVLYNPFLSGNFVTERYGYSVKGADEVWIGAGSYIHARGLTFGWE